MLYQCFDVFFTRFLGRIFLGHQTGETMAASLGWLLMDKIRGSPVEEKVVYLPSFTGFQKHPRWLFEISQPSNSSFILFLLPSQTIWSRHVFPGSSTMYLETKLQLPDIVTTGRFVPNKQGTGFPASYVSLPEGTTLGFHVVSSNIRFLHTVVGNPLEFSIQLSEFPLLNHWKRWQLLQWRPGGGGKPIGRVDTSEVGKSGLWP